MLWAVPLGLCSGEGCSKNGVSAVVALLHHDCGDGLVATRDASSGNWQFSDGSLVTFTRRLQRFTAHNFPVDDERDDEVTVVSVGGWRLAHPDDLCGGDPT